MADVLSTLKTQLSTHSFRRVTGRREADALGVSMIINQPDAPIEVTTASGDVVGVATPEQIALAGGAAFTAFVENETTNTGEMTLVAFATPATPDIKVRAKAYCAGAATFSAYEKATGAVVDVNEGADLDILNRDRGSATVSALKNTDTVPEAGKASFYNEAAAAAANLVTTTPIFSRAIAAGQTIDIEEFVLKASAQYAFVIAAATDDTVASKMTLNFDQVA